MRTLVLTTPHLKGHDVEYLQALLQKKGWYKGPLDGEYDPLTAQAVHRAKFWLGYLNPDQSAGDPLVSFLDGGKKPTLVMRTLAAKRLAADKHKSLTRGQEIVQRAASQLGTKESPPDSNEVVYAHWYGIIGSWCAMFVTWVFVTGRFSKTFTRGSHYAYVPYIVADARRGANGLMLAHGPASGIVVCFDWNGDGVADHVGIGADPSDLNKIVPGAIKAAIKAFGPLGPDDFWAIEGNTAVGNESNGGEVMLRKRSRDEVQCFVKVAA